MEPVGIGCSERRIVAWFVIIIIVIMLIIIILMDTPNLRFVYVLFFLVILC